MMSTESKGYANHCIHEWSLEAAARTQISWIKYCGIREMAVVDMAVNAVSMSSRPVFRQCRASVITQRRSPSIARRKVSSLCALCESSESVRLSRFCVTRRLRVRIPRETAWLMRFVFGGGGRVSSQVRSVETSGDLMQPQLYVSFLVCDLVSEHYI